jgi:hypothetical protein
MDITDQSSGENEIVACLAKCFSERSLYAPYWYIDELTESWIEVKNNLGSPLSVIPLLTLLNGPTISLNVVTIAPLATVRIGIKEQPQIAQLRSHTQKEPGGRPFWGDGSRPKSLLGSAQLVPISPMNSKAKSLSAWILTQNQKERLGIVTTFEDPGDLTTPTDQEGLWWLPFPGTKAYFSLQNVSPFPIELQVDLISDGGKVVTKYLPLEVAASHQLEIGELLGVATPPAMGGIRVSTLCSPGQTQRSVLLGRGRLIHEGLGFASPLRLHESLGDVSAPRGSELHSPAAYFGQLDKVVRHSRAFLHPHLLLRNTRNYEIIAEPILYGKDEKDEVAEFRLKPIKLEPQAVTHVDLQEQRKVVSPGTLADGVAGFRLIHSGCPTDVVAELINIEENGKFAHYDAIRNLSFHLAATQIAVSFNLALRNQSFLFLKNVTDKFQKPRVLLDYDDGNKQYDVVLPEVPPQQVSIVDIKRLRDTGTPDRNGQVLPPDVEFGGSAIFMEHGAFVIGDPTYMFPTPTVAEATTFSEIAEPDPPGNNDPNGPNDVDRPDFVPTCARGGDREPPGGQPQPSFRTVKIWLNAFIPRDIPGQTFPAPGIFAGKTMIKPGCIPPLNSGLHFCYLTDQRGFNLNIHASSRMHSEIVIDVTTANVLYQWHHCDCTQELICETGTPSCAKNADTSRMNFPLLFGSPNGVISVDLDAASRNECVFLSRLFGDIKVTGRFTIDVRARTVSFDGSVSVVPAYEAYATADDGAGRPLFILDPAPGASPCDLPLMVMRPVRGFTTI